jgi:hypothetical protein
MLKYTRRNESSNVTRFLIYSPLGNIYMLSLEKKDIEELDFDDVFLQENIV